MWGRRYKGMKRELKKPVYEDDNTKVLLYIGEGCQVGNGCGDSGDNCYVGDDCGFGNGC